MRRSHAVAWIWAMFAVVIAAIVVTYSRLPPYQLYRVVGRGFLHGGLSRAVVYVNFPLGLAAMAMLVATADRMSRARRVAAVVAALLWLPVFSSSVLSESYLDAHWSNAVPAVGVALAAALTLTTGTYRPDQVRGDLVRVAIGGVLLLLALPWIAAELGFHFNGVPVLGQVFQTGELRHQPGSPRIHQAVHYGDHHGLEATLLVISALLLSRILGAVRGRKLHAALGLLCALLITYGIGNIANDFWLEQVVKRGWTSWLVPNVLRPQANWGWLVIALGAVVLWLLVFRPRYPSRTEPAATSSAISSSE